MSTDPGTAANPRRWLALAVIATASLMVVLDASIVNIALPQAQAELRISDANRHWVITAYALAFGGLLLLGGRIADFAGRKRAFVIGLLGFAAASTFGGFAENAATLLSARALQGVFAALLTPAALSLIAVTFVEPHERAKAFGVYGAVQGGGGALGLILGGLLTEYVGWRWCLFVNVPIAAAAVLAALPTVRESRAEGERRYDVPGAVLVTGGLVALVYGFTEAAREGVGWLAPTTLGLLAGAVVLLVAFVVVEARAALPLLPLRVLRDRNRGGSFIASVLIGAGMFGMLLFLTFYFQVNLGYEPLQAGLAFLPFSGGIIVASGLASALLPRFGAKPLMVSGVAAATLALFWLTRLDASSTFLVGVLPSEIIMSLGLGLFFVSLSTVALSGVGPRDAGVASATLNTTQQIGGALGPALLNTVYVSAVGGYLTSNPPGLGGAAARQLDGLLYGYRVAFTVAGCLFALALLAIIVLVKAGAGKGDAATGQDTLTVAA